MITGDAIVVRPGEGVVVIGIPLGVVRPRDGAVVWI